MNGAFDSFCCQVKTILSEDKYPTRKANYQLQQRQITRLTDWDLRTEQRRIMEKEVYPQLVATASTDFWGNMF